MTVSKKVDTSRGVTRGGGGDTGPLPSLGKRVVSGDRNTGRLAEKSTRRSAKDSAGQSAKKRRALS